MDEIETTAFIMESRCRLANSIAKFGGFKLIAGSFGLQTQVTCTLKPPKFGDRVVKLDEMMKLGFGNHLCEGCGPYCLS